MKKAIQIVCVAAIVAGVGSAAVGVHIETVPVDNIGNTGELSGAGAGGYGTNRISGAVDYGYSIGKYEVTAGEYTEFLNAVAGTDTYGLYNTDMGFWCGIQRAGSSGSYAYATAVGWHNRPVVCVSWDEAARFVNWLENGQLTGAQDVTTTEDGAYYLNGATTVVQLRTVRRKSNARYVVPSEDEWYKAAYHKNDGVSGNYWDYPTGTNARPSNDLISPDPGNNANFDDLGQTIGPPWYTTEVGEFENSQSRYGTFDQGGNVWEWTEAALYGSASGFRGASWYVGVDALAANFRTHCGMDYEGGDVGFRVAEIPEPATLSLLALGGLGVVRRRRKQ